MTSSSHSSAPSTGQHLLVLDDDPAVVSYLAESLSDAGYTITAMTSPKEALHRIREEHIDLVITDVEMPDIRGIDLLKSILKSKPHQLVLLITAFGSVEMAVKAVRDGACDFLTKPFTIEVLLLAIERAFRERMLRREIVRLRSELNPQPKNHLVAQSPAMRKILDTLNRVSSSDIPILITGETGSGKSVLARYLHDNSDRRQAPFLQLNCAALPASLAESELFGLRKGAFTDAREDREGLFVASGQGILFLDEIGELPLGIQAKLLRTLDSRTVRPLGSNHEIPIQARVIAATNESPEKQLRNGTLRADLYYRISVIRIEIPPLRDRREDIIPLTDTFLAISGPRHQRPLIGMSSQAMKRLVNHSWPGNVRELANVVERAVAMTEHDTILPEDLELSDSEMPSTVMNTDAHLQTLDQMERAYILKVLTAAGGNKAAAAKTLGITRRTLYRKLNSFLTQDPQD